jgi:hypothetical protein
VGAKMNEITCDVECVSNDIRNPRLCGKPAICAYVRQETGKVYYRCKKHERGFALTFKNITLEEAIAYEVMND